MKTSISTIQKCLTAIAVAITGLAAAEAGDVRLSFHVNRPAVTVRRPSVTVSRRAACSRCRRTTCVCRSYHSYSRHSNSRYHYSRYNYRSRHNYSRHGYRGHHESRRPTVVVHPPQPPRPPVVVCPPRPPKPPVVRCRTHSHRSHCDCGSRRQRVVETPTQRAWRQLDEGWSRTAYYQFREIIKCNPNNAEAQIGFAVAAYRIDRRAEAVTGIRMAFRNGPGALQRLNCTRSVRRDLCSIRTEASTVACSRTRKQHGYFTVAAVSYVLGDEREARKSITLAVSNGDRQSSTVKLARALRVRCR